MGRQVIFLAAAGDIDMLGRHLQSAGAVFVPHRTRSSDIAARLDFPAQDAGLLPWVVRPDDVHSLSRWYVEQQGDWVIDRFACPLVEVHRGSVDDPNNHGRVYFDTVIQRDGQWVEAPSEFLDWAETILRWVRRHFVRDAERRLYIGPELARRMATA